VKFQKILLLTIIMALSTTQLFAVEPKKNETENNKTKLANVSISVSSTYSYINPITDVDINTNPIQTGSLDVILLPDDLGLHLGYSRTLTATANSETGKVSSTKHAAEQINIELPLSKIYLDGWSLLYTHYLFNTSLTPTGNRDVWLIDKSNSTAVTGSVSADDGGVSRLIKGENGQLTIKINRYEIRKYIDKRFAGIDVSSEKRKEGNGAYLALFYEELEKPFEDPTAEWYADNGEKIVVVYSQASFKSIGISFGAKLNDDRLKQGFNISHIYFDFAKTEIDLTNNFSLEDKLSDNYQLYRASMGGEIAYKIPLSYIKGSLVFGAYANYDYYYIDDTQTSNDQSLPISDDYLVGARVALHF
jgi:hypothetical protein